MGGRGAHGTGAAVAWEGREDHGMATFLIRQVWDRTWCMLSSDAIAFIDLVLSRMPCSSGMSWPEGKRNALNGRRVCSGDQMRGMGGGRDLLVHRELLRHLGARLRSGGGCQMGCRMGKVPGRWLPEGGCQMG